MKVLLILLGIISLSYQDSSQESQKADLIKWNPKLKLSWDDYKGEPDSLSTYAALTFYEITQEQISKSDRNIVLQVTCFFDRSLSWSKDKESESLLRHERLHFDI